MAGPVRTEPDVVMRSRAPACPGEEPNVREGGGMAASFWASRRPKTTQTWPDQSGRIDLDTG